VAQGYDKTVTIGDAARLLGISPNAVGKRIKSGTIAGLMLRDLFDAAERSTRPEAVAAVRAAAGDVEGAGPAKGGAKAPGSRSEREPKTSAEWQRLKTREEALKARLQRQELQGALVRRSVVEAAWATEGATIRDQLMQLGPKLAGRLAAETDPRVCSRLVDDEVVIALRGLSQAAVPEGRA